MPIDKSQRAVMYIKDIEKITGRKPSAARRLMRNIRKKLQKESHELISVEDFCLYTGIREGLVYDLLDD